MLRLAKLLVPPARLGRDEVGARTYSEGAKALVALETGPFEGFEVAETKVAVLAQESSYRTGPVVVIHDGPQCAGVE